MPASLLPIGVNQSERLLKVEGYRRLSTIQKRVILWHLKDPSLSKEEIAKTMAIRRDQVYEVFQSEVFSELTDELAKQVLGELTLTSVKVLKDILECKDSKDISVPLMNLKSEIAIMILKNGNIIRSNMKNGKADQSMVVFWGEKGKKKRTILGESVDTAVNDVTDVTDATKESNGAGDILPASSQAG